MDEQFSLMIKAVDHASTCITVRVQQGQERDIRSHGLMQQANQKLMGAHGKLNATDTVLADLNEHIYRLHKLLQAEHQ